MTVSVGYPGIRVSGYPGIQVSGTALINCIEVLIIFLIPIFKCNQYVFAQHSLKFEYIYSKDIKFQNILILIACEY